MSLVGLEDVRESGHKKGLGYPLSSLQDPLFSFDLLFESAAKGYYSFRRSSSSESNSIFPSYSYSFPGLRLYL